MKKDNVEKETDEQKNARWAKQMKQAKAFAKCALTKAQRRHNDAERMGSKYSEY